MLVRDINREMVKYYESVDVWVIYGGGKESC